MSHQKKLVIVTVVVFLGLFFVGAYFFKAQKLREAQKAASSHQGSLIRDYSPSLGSPMLRVTLVEFLDPECESCAFFHPIVKGLLKRYEGSIRYVVRYAPFHSNSQFIIKILEASRNQNKYWEALDLLFEKLPEWGSHQNPKPELVWVYLSELGLDIERLKKDMKNKEIAKRIEQEIEDLKVLGVRQTPSFFINGEPLKSFGAESLEAAIKKALEE